MALQRLRGRMPIVVFVLLAVVCAVLLGFACACLTDHPAQALERAVSALTHMPAVIEVWAFLPLVAGLGLVSVWLVLSARTSMRASPALLQRFLL